MAKVAPSRGSCTFDAADSSYYRGLSADPARLLGTGPIRFSWNRATGTVSATGGSWREYLAQERVWVTFGNVVDSGTVSRSGAVTLKFMGTPLTAGVRPYRFTLSGTLSALSGSSRLTGRADGANLFSAAGRVTCRAASPAPKPAPRRAAQQARRTVTVVRVVTVRRSAPTVVCRSDDEDENGDEDDGPAADGVRQPRRRPG